MIARESSGLGRRLSLRELERFSRDDVNGSEEYVELVDNSGCIDCDQRILDILSQALTVTSPCESVPSTNTRPSRWSGGVRHDYCPHHIQMQTLLSERGKRRGTAGQGMRILRSMATTISPICSPPRTIVLAQTSGCKETNIVSLLGSELSLSICCR